jgi:hypothetical protein
VKGESKNGRWPSASARNCCCWPAVGNEERRLSDTVWPYGATDFMMRFGERIWRAGKQVTNGSKTAVVDVIAFLCVSLGSSTVQLHYSLGRRRARACSQAGFSSQHGDRA